jgi:hypothetical protein
MKVANNFVIAWTQQPQPNDSKLAEIFRNFARVCTNHIITLSHILLNNEA